MIEYDSDKNSINIEKHGISFDEAVDLFQDPDLLELKARSMDEPRFLLIGKIKEKFWSAIVTYRKNKIRFISVRRARKEEVDFYESQRT
ncbi:BrnT family toxin [bacterium]|nr:BrnT family toxin [bacterium]